MSEDRPTLDDRAEAIVPTAPAVDEHPVMALIRTLAVEKLADVKLRPAS